MEHRREGLMRLHVIVCGRVQGVGFRWFVRESAARLDVAGWVKNLSDGTVEVSAEAELIDRLRAALAVGPPGATVTSVDDTSDDGAPLGRPFGIHRHPR
jgi:acylphosphatase